MVVRGSQVPVGRAIPHLVVHDAAGAAEFYERAFGAEEVYRSKQPWGSGLHIHLRIADSIVIVADANGPRDPASIDAHYKISSPQALGGTTAVFQIFWPDADSAYKRAVEAGAQPTVPPFDAFWGDRYGCVTDPFGHVWAIATEKEVLSPEEIDRRMRQAYPLTQPAPGGERIGQFAWRKAMPCIRKLAILILLFVCSTAWPQQKPTPDWDAWKFLQGKWVGEGSSELGQGSGYFSFEPDLQNKVWVRRNHSEYPATKDRPTYVHEDLMVVYFDKPAERIRAFYCDTEGHVIHYTAAFSNDGKTLTFLGDRQEGAPRYRLTYVLGEPGHMSVALEMAQPGKPDDFQKIVEGKVRKLSSP